MRGAGELQGKQVWYACICHVYVEMTHVENISHGQTGNEWMLNMWKIRNRETYIALMSQENTNNTAFHFNASKHYIFSAHNKDDISLCCFGLCESVQLGSLSV